MGKASGQPPAHRIRMAINAAAAPPVTESHRLMMAIAQNTNAATTESNKCRCVNVVNKLVSFFIALVRPDHLFYATAIKDSG
jgi:hypothetical protein